MVYILNSNLIFHFEKFSALLLDFSEQFGSKIVT